MSASPTPEKFSRIELRAAPVEERRATGHERDVLVERAREQVGRVDVVRQRRPDEQPALRMRPRALRAEALGERVEHDVAPAAVDLLQRVHVVLPAPAREVRRDEELRQRRRAQVGRLLADVHLLEHRPRADAPAQPHARREDLRERAEVDDEVAAVERVERRQRLALVAQQAVRVVLEDEQLALADDLDEALAARQRHRRPGRVLERRDGVDELRPLALARQARERVLEDVDAHAVGVALDLDDLAPGRSRTSAPRRGTSAPRR